jgi:peptidoglycan hydrolase-like protein with peptidoglycan-binding domain
MWALVKQNIMSELGLLMTGMLKTTKEPSPNLSDKSSIQQGRRVEDSVKSESLDMLASFPITPPEFIPIDGEMDRQVIGNSVSINFELQNILSEFTDKISLGNFSQTKLLAMVTKGENNNLVPISNRGFKTPSLPTLEYGNSGVSVRVLQRLLVSNGYTVRVDGLFGAFTETGVKAFQSSHNLATDGIVGENTWRELTK